MNIEVLFTPCFFSFFGVMICTYYNMYKYLYVTIKNKEIKIEQSLEKIQNTNIGLLRELYTSRRVHYNSRKCQILQEKT